MFFTLGTVIGYVVNIITVVGTAVASVGLWPIIIAAALGALVVLVIMNWDKIVEVVKAAIALIAQIFKDAWVGLKFVMAAAVEGFTFRELCLEILALAVERERGRQREAAA